MRVENGTARRDEALLVARPRILERPGAKERRTAPPYGLAELYRRLAEVRVGWGRDSRTDYAARVLRWLSEWAPAYLRVSFATERPRWTDDAWQELEQDAVQHVLLAAIRRAPERWAQASDDFALYWTKRVAKNFMISHGVRWRTKQRAIRGDLSHDHHSIELELLTRCSAAKLLALARTELSFIVAPRHLLRVLRDLEALFEQRLGSSCRNPGEKVVSEGPKGGAARQRRRRVRRLTERAFDRLRARLAATDDEDDLIGLAELLGIALSKK